MADRTDTFGRLLVNDLLPEEHKISGPMTKKSFYKMLDTMSRETPDVYVRVVPELKRLGDSFATTEGLSVGLDDITPDYKDRNSTLEPFAKRFDAAKTDKIRSQIAEEAHGKMQEVAMRNPGTMTMQVQSGARGNPSGYASIIATPTYARDGKGNAEPWLIRKSHSEGLSSADNWVASNEAILNTISTYTAVSEPGELAKVLVSNMSNIIITEDDCGTTNGVFLPTLSSSTLDRYLAKEVGGFKHNTLITSLNQPKLAKISPTILVRSPMTCEAGDGVCQKCQGLNEKGSTHDIGTNVGVRAAQAMAEPLTQFALGAKHGARTAKDDRIKIKGIQGLRQITESPQQFINKATLAQLNGTVERVTVAPQGGHYVFVGGQQHYVTPNLDVIVKVGSPVQAGDALSQGIPKPDEVVRLKGLGVGRQYIVDSLVGLYKDQGRELDQRHFELLAKGELNYVRVLKDPSRNFIPGDVVSYNVLRNELKKGTKVMPVGEADGETLGQAYFHFYSGTRVTPQIQAYLKQQGIKEVVIAPRAPEVEFIMKAATRAPLLNPDWMARLAHRNLKTTVMHATHFGESSDIHGTHPVPAYITGVEFGQGPKGKY
jgi:DNA-directed RNA polymerase subunit beta'